MDVDETNAIALVFMACHWHIVTKTLWVWLTWVMTDALMGLILLPHADACSEALSPGAPFSGSGGKASR